MKLCIAFLYSVVICTEAQVPHKDITLRGYSDSDEKTDMMVLDGEELVYIDFNKKEPVNRLPEFVDQFTFPGFYEGSISALAILKNNLKVCKEVYKNPPEAQDPPQSTIYPRDYVELGKENTLICFISNFFPPPVKVKWTRNDIEVKEEVTLGSYYPNDDGTFNQFSTLSFTPEEGDIYACTVEHKALTDPQTRMWEPEVTPQAGVGATVFCGLGLTVGLLGVATGTFFLIKGNNCN